MQSTAPSRTAPAHTGNPIAEIDSVHKRFATRSGEIVAVEEASFTVREREFISLLGPSGCGKSTPRRWRRRWRSWRRTTRPTSAAPSSSWTVG